LSFFLATLDEGVAVAVVFWGFGLKDPRGARPLYVLWF